MKHMDVHRREFTNSITSYLNTWANKLVTSLSSLIQQALSRAVLGLIWFDPRFVFTLQCWNGMEVINHEDTPTIWACQNEHVSVTPTTTYMRVISSIYCQIIQYVDTPMPWVCQHEHISRPAYWFNSRGAVPFTCTFVLIRIESDWSRQVVPSGSIGHSLGYVYTRSWFDPDQTDLNQSASVNRLLAWQQMSVCNLLFATFPNNCTTVFHRAIPSQKKCIHEHEWEVTGWRHSLNKPRQSLYCTYMWNCYCWQWNNKYVCCLFLNTCLIICIIRTKAFVVHSQAY